MIASRTRAFGIIVILAQSEFNLVGSPLYGIALNRVSSHRRFEADRPRKTRESRRDVPSGLRVA